MNKSQENVVARTDDSQKGIVDNPIETINPFDNLATEDNDEADLIQEQVKSQTSHFNVKGAIKPSQQRLVYRNMTDLGILTLETQKG